MGKEPTCNEGDPGDLPRSGRFRRRAWQPTPVFLPGESHGQSSLAGYSPWDHKESDTTVTNHSTAGPVVKNPPANTGDVSSIPGSG